MALTKLTVALDWEPNANHAGKCFINFEYHSPLSARQVCHMLASEGVSSMQVQPCNPPKQLVSMRF